MTEKVSVVLVDDSVDVRTLVRIRLEASDAFVYSKLVDEVMSEPDRYRDREIRVEGQLQEGSVHFVAER